MKQKEFNQIAGTILIIVGILHIARAIQGLPILIGDWITPLWLSIVVGLIVGYVGASGLRLK